MAMYEHRKKMTVCKPKRESMQKATLTDCSIEPPASRDVRK
jgi:hypothetical protein